MSYSRGWFTIARTGFGDVLSAYFQDLHSLRLTASLPLKIDDWKVPIRLPKLEPAHFFPGA